PNTGELATLEQRSASFEMPSTLNIGGSYDFLFGDMHKLTAAFAFSANSFSNDQYRLGVNYGMTGGKMHFNIMAGYVLEKGIFSSDGLVPGGRVTALSGLTAGVSI